MSRIEQVIDEIEDYVASCKGTVFSSGNKVVVDKVKMDELLSELRHRTPDEIKKYQKIVSNKEAILAEAKSQAEQMIADATAQTNELINEHEIMQRAYEQAQEIRDDAEKQAQEIVDRAVDEANAIRESAISYTDDMLNSMLVVMKHAMEGADSKFVAYMQSMQSSYDIVESNLSELRGVNSQSAPIEEAAEAENVEKAQKVGIISEDDDDYDESDAEPDDDYDDDEY